MGKRENTKNVVLAVTLLTVTALFVSVAIAQPLPVTVKGEVMDEIGNLLLGDGSETSDLVQLINVGPNGVISPPDENGNPTGDDSKICDIRIGSKYFPDDGRFSHDLGLEAGTVIYCRAWNDATVADATHYGNSDMMTVTGAGDYNFGTWSMGTFFPEPVNEPPVADAGPDQTAQIDETVTFSGSGSYDSDGTINSYVWDFSDGATGTGEITTHPYTTAGTYTVTLTVTDNDGATGTDTAVVTVTAPAMHIASIDMSTTKYKAKGWFTYATAAVTVVDADGKVVEGATVEGQWSGLTSDTDSGATGADGKASLDSDSVKNAKETFTFSVDNVVLNGWTYDSASNVETGDSITV